MPSVERRTPLSLLRWLLPLVLVLACTEHGPEAPPDTPRPSHATKAEAPATPTTATPTTATPTTATPTAATPTAATPITVVTPATPTTATPTTEVTPATPVAPVEPALPAGLDAMTPDDLEDRGDADWVQAYVADCSHRAMLGDPDAETEGSAAKNPVTECDYFQTDQNCMPDPGGCWEDGQSCMEGCHRPCNTCEDECSAGCGRCKDACPAGATECIRTCAEARLACRNTCQAAMRQCREVDCPAAEEKCNAAFSRKRKKLCPQCPEIGACYSRDYSGDEDLQTVCARELPKARKECFEWCWHYSEDEDP